MNKSLICAMLMLVVLFSGCTDETGTEESIQSNDSSSVSDTSEMELGTITYVSDAAATESDENGSMLDGKVEQNSTSVGNQGTNETVFNGVDNYVHTHTTETATQVQTFTSSPPVSNVTTSQTMIVPSEDSTTYTQATTNYENGDIELPIIFE